jgi:hypothetical protein
MSTQDTTAGTNQEPRSSSIWEIYYPHKIAAEHRDCIYIASFSEIVFFWPLLLTCFLCASLQSISLFSPTAAGWLFVVVLTLNLLVLVQNFDQKQFVILILVLVALGLAVWIVNLYGFSFLRHLAHWILSFEPQFSTHSYLMIGTVLLVYFLWGLTAPLFSYWRLEQNDFVHYTRPAGRDLSVARMGCSVYKEIPDIFQCLLTIGGGNLIIKRDNNILASINNVPFLSLRMAIIEDMLDETRVTVAGAPHSGGPDSL